MDIISIIIGFVAGAVLALAVYILVRRAILKGKRDEILEKAEIEGEKIKNERILQAKEKYLSLKSEHEKTVNEKNAQIREAENRVRQKENTLNQKLSETERKSKELDNQKNQKTRLCEGTSSFRIKTNRPDVSLRLVGKLSINSLKLSIESFRMR